MISRMKCLKTAPVVLAGALALAGCNQTMPLTGSGLVPTTSVDQSHPRATLVLASAPLVSDIVLTNPQFQPVGQLTRAQVTVQNVSEKRFSLEYKFDWEDPQGFAVNSAAMWQRFTLSPRQVRKFTSTGKVPEATNITFTVRLPDDAFILQESDEYDRQPNNPFEN